MPLRVERRPRARADLLEIWEYIATDSEAAADRVLRRIAEICDMLGSQPKAGRLRPELDVDGLRSFHAGRYVVYYQASADAIIVVRVLEGHRDVEAVFDRDERSGY